MKKRGFTLIELLAVIVVLAIIALIATPIVMNVIKKAGLGAAERSADNYVKAVETLIATEKLDGTPMSDGEYIINSTGKLTKDGKEYEVEVSGTKPVNGTITIRNGQVVKDATTTIDYEDYTVKYPNGKAEASEKSAVAKLCTLTDGGANTVGAKYTCDLGETEDTKGLVFYVLEAGTSEKDASLILERNYDDTTQPWCSSGYDATCNANGLTTKINEIVTSWSELSEEQIKLPSAEQIASADGQTFVSNTLASGIPLSSSWLTNNIIQYGGYWTTTPGSPNNGMVHYVNDDAQLSYVGVDYPNGVGVRPVITLPISEL